MPGFLGFDCDSGPHRPLPCDGEIALWDLTNAWPANSAGGVDVPLPAPRWDRNAIDWLTMPVRSPRNGLVHRSDT